MKRKKLPYSLMLVIIVLAGVILSFVNPRSKALYHARNTPYESLSRGSEQAVTFLASIRNNQHTGFINPQDIRRAKKQLEKIEISRAGYDLGLTSMGPDNFGGRTRALLFDNRDISGNTLYAGAVTGGIWKSTNYGINWEKVNLNGRNLNVSCMVQTPNGTLYVGTGENFSSQTMAGTGKLGYRTGFVGKGIFKSTDGENFTLIPATAPDFNDVNSDWTFINKLAVVDDNTIYAATNTGLKVSTNSGDTWVTASVDDTTMLASNAFDVDVGNDGTVYGVVNNLLYVSANGDAAGFVLRSTGDSLSLPNTKISRMEIAVAPSDPNIVYASLADEYGSMKGVYRSEDKGSTWQLIMPATESLVVFDGQGVYDNVLTVFPNNPDKVLLGGTDMWVGIKPTYKGLFNWEMKSVDFGGPFYNLYVHVDHHKYVFAPNGTNVFICTDGGITKGTLSGDNITFQPINSGYITTQFYTVAACGDEHYVMGGAQDNGVILITGDGNTVQEGNDIWFHNTGFFNGGDGGGVAISIINPKVIVYGSTAGAVRRSEDAGTNISTQFLGKIGNPQAFKTPVALWESFDNINSRDSINYHAREFLPADTNIIVKSANSNYPFHYTVPFDIQQGDSIMIQDIVSSRLFLATANYIYMTKELHNFGKTPEWFLIANASVGYTGIPYSISFSADGNHLFVGNNNGKLYRISNLALAYDSIRADVRSSQCIVSIDKIPVYVPGTNDEISQAITSISVDPQNPTKVLITLGNYGNEYYVLYSENALDEAPQFQSRQGNLPQMPVYSSLIDMKDEGFAVIGTEMGLFITTDVTANSPVWQDESSDLGHAIVFDLQQQRLGKESINDGLHTFPAIYNYGDIYGATYGRGIIHSLSLRQPVGIEENHISNKTSNLKIYPNPAESYTTIVFDSPQSGQLILNIFDISGKNVYTAIKHLSIGINTIELDVNNYTKGIYIIKARLGNHNYQQKFIVK